MTATIASREYKLTCNGSHETISVDIGTPVPRLDLPTCWYCPFSIKRAGRVQQLSADGADSVQALTLAVSALSAILGHLATEGTLTFLDGVEGPGLPRA